MRLALATRDWDQVRSYCLQYETLTLKELSDRTNHDANGINVCEEVLRSLQPMVSISKRRERASRIWKHCSYRHSDFYELITLLMCCMES